MDAREPHHHVVTESIERVVCSSGGDPLERKARPLWELSREQPAHERYIDIYLIDMHLGFAHDGPIA